jgi:methylase of polypeptide subunit release factors
MPAAVWRAEPFIAGTAGQFADARGALERIGFTEPAICAGGEVASIYDLSARREREIGFLEPDSPLSLAVQLFMDGEDVAWETARAVFAPADLLALEAVGLVQSLPDDPSRCAAFVALYPNEGLYIASDRHARIQLVATGKPADVVYSALTPETQRFVRLMPRTPCNDYLELCSGAGVAALVAARDFAAQVWAVDITERSTRFAAFNAALNGLRNVTALAGDLYAPVSGRTFDVITAHPPYVPSSETEMVFRDGGEDGEHVTRNIIAGLPEHLRPGGRFHCDCMMTDRVDAPVEQRIRDMLGAAHGDFDVLVGEVAVIESDALIGGSVRSGRLSTEAAAAQRALFQHLGVERFVSVDFLIRRHAGEATAVTRRRVISPATRAEHLDWYLDYAGAVADWPTGSSRYLDARPRALPHTELLSRSAMESGRWRVTASSLVTQVPFLVQAECPSWFATFLTWCDGSATARALLLRLRNAGILDETDTDADFALVIGELADRGFVGLDVPPVPVGMSAS